MTIKELIEKLKEYDENIDVQYGNQAGTFSFELGYKSGDKFHSNFNVYKYYNGNEYLEIDCSY